MRFVRSLSDALNFRPWLRFWSLVCISSGCGRFVALWGFCCVVCGLWSDALRVSCGPSVGGSCVDRWQLFRFAGFGRMLCGLAWRRISSAMGFYFALWVLLRLWSFFRSVGFLRLRTFGSGSAFGRGCGVGFWVWFARCRFGYNFPVVFSASFWDPLRLLLLSWFYIPGGGWWSRCRSPRRV